MPETSDRYSVLADQIILKVKLNGKHKVPTPQTSKQVAEMIRNVVADDATVLARDAAINAWQKRADQTADLVDELLNAYRQLAAARQAIVDLLVPIERDAQGLTRADWGVDEKGNALPDDQRYKKQS